MSGPQLSTANSKSLTVLPVHMLLVHHCKVRVDVALICRPATRKLVVSWRRRSLLPAACHLSVQGELSVITL